MKMISLRPMCCLGTLAAALLAVAGGGCASTSTQHSGDPVNPSKPFAFPGQPGQMETGFTNTNPPVSSVFPRPGNPGTNADAVKASTLRVGDVVTISFADTREVIQPQKTQIAEDGTLALPLNIRVQAVGKTPRQLEQEIRGEYVPKYYRFLTVTVQTEQRAFFVGGEVKLPNRIPYVGEMTVSRAIQAAGDFTDFANRKKIELIRENGQRYKLNWYKILEDHKLDLPVFPNDQIIVTKRGLW